MRTIIIIQARMGSSRLPGKILKPLGDADVLTYVVERCRRVAGVENVIVATSVLPQDDAVEAWGAAHGTEVFRGSEEDVLDRYVQCAKRYEPDYVMRVTADCPFVDYELASAMVEKMKESRVDVIDLVGEMPRGLASEIVSFRALLHMHEHGREPRHREHVTYYAYEYPDRFARESLPVPEELRQPKQPRLRITLDTEEDYALCRAVADHFRDVLVPSAEVVAYLRGHPDIAALNAHVEQKPVI
jgi:spore coat polysaccharide biosynthesis protein SpsF